jgi:1,4-alpha-glucan branching enzyme
MRQQTTSKAGGKKQIVQFEFEARPGSEVFVSGTFNSWSPKGVKMKDEGDGHFTREVPVPVGRHEYKFVVNGQWTADPACPRWDLNRHGSLNSVVLVGG